MRDTCLPGNVKGSVTMGTHRCEERGSYINCFSLCVCLCVTCKKKLIAIFFKSILIFAGLGFWKAWQQVGLFLLLVSPGFPSTVLSVCQDINIPLRTYFTLHFLLLFILAHSTRIPYIIFLVTYFHGNLFLP